MARKRRKQGRSEKGLGTLTLVGEKKWKYRVTINGHEHATRFYDCETVEDAKKQREEFLRSLEQTPASCPPKLPKHETVQVGELIDDYIRHLYENKKKSAFELERALRNTVAPFQFADGVTMQDRLAASITSDDLRAYRDTRLDADIADATINNELSYLRSAYYHGKDRQTPKKVIEIPYFPVVSVDNARTGFVEWEGYEKLLAHMPDSLKLFLVVGYHSGCRSGEIKELNVRQVLWKQRVIELEPGTTKNKEGRYLPFYGDLERWLLWQEEVRQRECPDVTSLLFWHQADTDALVRLPPGSPIKSFHRMWHRAVEAAGYADFIPHDLRRSAVRNMIQYAGIDESRAMKISGHKTNSMIKRYNIVNLASLQDAGARMDNWLKSRKEQTLPMAVPSPIVSVTGEPSPAVPKVVQMPSIKERARQLRAEGKSIAEIAQSLGISLSTAHYHLSDSAKATTLKRNRKTKAAARQVEKAATSAAS